MARTPAPDRATPSVPGDPTVGANSERLNELAMSFKKSQALAAALECDLFSARITSYNVCYTKLLRSAAVEQPRQGVRRRESTRLGHERRHPQRTPEYQNIQQQYLAFLVQRSYNFV